MGEKQPFLERAAGEAVSSKETQVSFVWGKGRNHSDFEKREILPIPTIPGGFKRWGRVGNNVRKWDVQDHLE